VYQTTVEQSFPSILFSSNSLHSIMPKIISSSIVSSSDQLDGIKKAEKNFKVYYCLCGEFVLILGKKIKIIVKTLKNVIIKK